MGTVNCSGREGDEGGWARRNGGAVGAAAVLLLFVHGTRRDESVGVGMGVACL